MVRAWTSILRISTPSSKFPSLAGTEQIDVMISFKQGDLKGDEGIEKYSRVVGGEETLTREVAR